MSNLSVKLLGLAAGVLLVAPACTQVQAQSAPSTTTGSQPGTAAKTSTALSGNLATTAEATAENATLAMLSDAFKRFHEDTGGWPLGEGVWKAGTSAELAPTEATVHDTALFVKPDGMKQCDGKVAKPCWGGPYLSGNATSLADASLNDQWGHVHMFAYYRPRNGGGGGTYTAPDGAVLVWSRGPDGLDQVGCVEGSCSRDDNKIAAGGLSVDGADDLLTVVGTTK